MIRNYKTKFGEVDIIAKNRDETVFIEVKTRLSKRFGLPVEAVNNLKQKKIINTSKIYMKQNRIYTCKIRYDVIEVYLSGEKSFINHIKNVFF